MLFIFQGCVQTTGSTHHINLIFIEIHSHENPGSYLRGGCGKRAQVSLLRCWECLHPFRSLESNVRTNP